MPEESPPSTPESSWLERRRKRRGSSAPEVEAQPASSWLERRRERRGSSPVATPPVATPPVEPTSEERRVSEGLAALHPATVREMQATAEAAEEGAQDREQIRRSLDEEFDPALRQKLLPIEEESLRQIASQDAELTEVEEQEGVEPGLLGKLMSAGATASQKYLPILNPLESWPQEGFSVPFVGTPGALAGPPRAVREQIKAGAEIWRNIGDKVGEVVTSDEPVGVISRIPSEIWGDLTDTPAFGAFTRKGRLALQNPEAMTELPEANAAALASSELSRRGAGEAFIENVLDYDLIKSPGREAAEQQDFIPMPVVSTTTGEVSLVKVNLSNATPRMKRAVSTLSKQAFVGDEDEEKVAEAFDRDPGRGVKESRVYHGLLEVGVQAGAETPVQGFDRDGMLFALQGVILEEELLNKNVRWTSLSSKERDTLSLWARDEAKKEMAKDMQGGTGLPWLSIDPKKVSKMIAEQDPKLGEEVFGPWMDEYPSPIEGTELKLPDLVTWALRPAVEGATRLLPEDVYKAAVAPMIAALTPAATIEVFDQQGVKQIRQNLLWHLLNAAPTSVIGAWNSGPDDMEWMDEEHVHRIRTGWSIFDSTDDIGAWMLARPDWVASWSGYDTEGMTFAALETLGTENALAIQRTAGVLTAMPLVLFEPDASMVALYGIGKAGKAAKLGQKLRIGQMGRHQRAVDQLKDARKRLDEGVLQDDGTVRPATLRDVHKTIVDARTLQTLISAVAAKFPSRQAKAVSAISDQIENGTDLGRMIERAAELEKKADQLKVQGKQVEAEVLEAERISILWDLKKSAYDQVSAEAKVSKTSFETKLSLYADELTRLWAELGLKPQNYGKTRRSLKKIKKERKEVVEAHQSLLGDLGKRRAEFDQDPETMATGLLRAKVRRYQEAFPNRVLPFDSATASRAELLQVISEQDILFRLANLSDELRLSKLARRKRLYDIEADLLISRKTSRERAAAARGLGKEFREFKKSVGGKRGKKKATRRAEKSAKKQEEELERLDAAATRAAEEARGAELLDSIVRETLDDMILSMEKGLKDMAETPGFTRHLDDPFENVIGGIVLDAPGAAKKIQEAAIKMSPDDLYAKLVDKYGRPAVERLLRQGGSLAKFIEPAHRRVLADARRTRERPSGLTLWQRERLSRQQDSLSVDAPEPTMWGPMPTDNTPSLPSREAIPRSRVRRRHKISVIPETVAKFQEDERALAELSRASRVVEGGLGYSQRFLDEANATFPSQFQSLDPRTWLPALDQLIQNNIPKAMASRVGGVSRGHQSIYVGYSNATMRVRDETLGVINYSKKQGMDLQEVADAYARGELILDLPTGQTFINRIGGGLHRGFEALRQDVRVQRLAGKRRGKKDKGIEAEDVPLTLRAFSRIWLPDQTTTRTVMHRQGIGAALERAAAKIITRRRRNVPIRELSREDKVDMALWAIGEQAKKKRKKGKSSSPGTDAVETRGRLAEFTDDELDRMIYNAQQINLGSKYGDGTLEGGGLLVEARKGSKGIELLLAKRMRREEPLTYKRFLEEMRDATKRILAEKEIHLSRGEKAEKAAETKKGAKGRSDTEVRAQRERDRAYLEEVEERFNLMDLNEEGIRIPGFTPRISKLNDQSALLGLQTLMHAAIQHDSMIEAQRLFGGLSREQGQRLADLAGGRIKGFGRTTREFQLAFETLVEQGMSTTTGQMLRVRQGFTKVADTELRLAKVWQDGDEATFIPTTLLKEFDAGLEGLAKELSQFYQRVRDEPVGRAIAVFNSMLSAWRSVVVTGWFVLKGSHFLMTWLSDQAQMTVRSGFVTSARVSARALPAYVPFGKAAQDIAAQMAERLGVTDKLEILPTPLGAALDPNVAAVWRGASRIVRTASGELLDTAKMQRDMMEDGILETFYRFDQQTAMSLAIKRTAKAKGIWNIGKWLKRLEAEGRQLPQVWMSQIQQRQRASLYLEYRINRGATRKEAKKAVDEALYDWSHGVSVQELALIARFSAFYRYSRLATNQAFNAYAELLSHPPTLKNTLYGMNPHKRLRALTIYERDLPYALFADYKEDGKTYNDAEQERLAIQEMSPWYFEGTTRGNIPPAALSESHRRVLDDAGIEHTHYTRPLPSLGTSNSQLLLAELVGSLFYTAKMALGGDVPEGYLQRVYIDRFVDTLSPANKEAFQGMLSAATGYGRRSGSEWVSLNDDQKLLYQAYKESQGAALGHLGPGNIFAYVREKEGKLEWPTWAAMTTKHIPFVSQQIIPYSAAYFNVPEDAELNDRVQSVVATWLGVDKVLMSPRKDIAYDARDRGEAVERTTAEREAARDRHLIGIQVEREQRIKEREADND